MSIGLLRLPRDGSVELNGAIIGRVEKSHHLRMGGGRWPNVEVVQVEWHAYDADGKEIERTSRAPWWLRKRDAVEVIIEAHEGGA